MKQNAEVSLSLRNGTVDFLLYPRGAGEQGIEVRVQDGTVWLNQAGIAELYHIDRSVITKHIRQIYESKEQDSNQLVQKLYRLPITGNIMSAQKPNWQKHSRRKNTNCTVRFRTGFIKATLTDS